MIEYALLSRDEIDQVKSFNYVLYKARLEEFIDKCGFMDDGKASERVADIIQNELLC